MIVGEMPVNKVKVDGTTYFPYWGTINYHRICRCIPNVVQILKSKASVIFILQMLFLGDRMLTKEDLLVCTIPPNIKDVSLALYKEFAEAYLIGKVFHYLFLDGTELDVEFTEWGIYHMLSIQHINGKIDRNNFFREIENGLSFNDFTKEKSINNRFKKYKKRITLFACVYDTLKTGTAFYLPSGKVKGTANVSMDYILHKKYTIASPTGTTQNGNNIGIRQESGMYVPLTILISKNSDLEEYIRDDELKIVRKLEIKDKAGNIIDTVSYEFETK